MTNIYHATPYDISATGFYFSSFEEYQEKAKNHRNEYGELLKITEMNMASLLKNMKSNLSTVTMALCLEP